MRIIRFFDEHGETVFGEDAGEGVAVILEGSVTGGFRRTTRRERIARLLAPLIPTDIICIGRNYRPRADHSNPQQLHDDATLEVFLKPSTSLHNPDDLVVLPRFDGIPDIQLDCEGELAVIIGRGARNITERDALGHVFGYALANDITARHFQTPTGPPLWMRGKGFDAFCPIGPAIITADEIPDPQNLTLQTLVNGQVVRDGNTCDMIRSVPQIIAGLSRHMTLRAGALILTGAPPGEPRSLQTGDRIEVEIPSLGRLSNTVGTDARQSR